MAGLLNNDGIFVGDNPPQGQGDHALILQVDDSYLAADPVHCCHLKPADYIMVGNSPCQILEIPEVVLKTKDIFTGEEKIVRCRSTSKFFVPMVISDYYQILQLQDNGTLTLQEFDNPEAVSLMHIIDTDLKREISLSLAKREYETFCTVLKAFDRELIISVRSCPTYSDFYRLPFEMKERIFSLLPRSDLISLRSVCKAFAAIIPVSSLVSMYLMKISSGRITVRVEPVLNPPSYENTPPQPYGPSRVIQCPLAGIAAGLLHTIRHLEIRERVYVDDLSTIVDQCNQLHTIDLDYPTDETMDVLEQLVQSNKDTLRTFSIWDYFWYNSEQFAFECDILQPCRSLESLTLFVKHVKDIESIPRSLTYLKLDKISLSQVGWIVENLPHLKFLRFEVEHTHYPDDVNTKGQMFSDDNYPLLKKLCNLEKIEKLDLNFSANVLKKNYDATASSDVCPTVRRFHNVCKVPGIAGFCDNWDNLCTLELTIDRTSFVPFELQVDGE